MRLNKISLAAFVVGGSMLMSACGGGNDSPLRPISRVTSDITAAVTPDTVQAVLGTELTFAAGIEALGTTAPTTLTLSGTDPAKPSFTLKSGDYEAKGEMTYGSCIFKIVESNFAPATTFPLLQIGQAKEVSPCDVKVKTSGFTANGSSISTTMTFVLGLNASNSVPITVTISSTGVVTVNGVTLGTATVVVTTGAGG